MRGTKPKPTAQQKRAIALFQREILKGDGKSIAAILLEAGYAPESARQETNIMAGIKPHIAPFVERMEAHRQRVMERLEAKVDDAGYADLVRSLDVLTHNIQLLGGKPTANVALSAEVRAAIDHLIEP